MANPETSDRRLDSWKAIADYLRRDVATVRRWERQGLPVRRVPGGERRAVFAYTSELDAWLRAGHKTASAPAAATPAAATMPTPRRLGPRWLAPMLIAAVVVAAAAWWTNSTGASPELMVTTKEDAITATSAGVEQWRSAFPPALRMAFPSLMTESWRVARDGSPALYVAIANQVRRSDEASLGGVLLDFDLEGRQRQAFSFNDHVTAGGQSYDPPWGLTWFDTIDRPGGRRIALAAHHMLWSPGIVTVLDQKFARHGTFHHNGWIEFVEWLGPNRLVVAGYSDDQRGGMIGLLDANALDGPPLRLVVMPRTDVNLAAQARFNRAVVQRTENRLLARTIEVPQDGPQPAADIVYEFTMDLNLVRVTPGARYLELRKTPGPPAFPVMIWEPKTGWTKHQDGK